MRKGDRVLVYDCEGDIVSGVIDEVSPTGKYVCVRHHSICYIWMKADDIIEKLQK